MSSASTILTSPTRERGKSAPIPRWRVGLVFAFLANRHLKSNIRSWFLIARQNSAVVDSIQAGAVRLERFGGRFHTERQVGERVGRHGGEEFGNQVVQLRRPFAV